MMQPLAAGYRYLEVRRNYAGVAQRWLIIHSKAAEGRAHKSTQRRLRPLTEQEGSAFDRRCRQPFACEQEAYHALKPSKKH